MGIHLMSMSYLSLEYSYGRGGRGVFFKELLFMPRLSVKAAKNTFAWKKKMEKYQNFEKKNTKVFFLTVTPEPFSCNLLRNIFLFLL